MTRTTANSIPAALRRTCAAACVLLATAAGALADAPASLERLLAEPTSFSAISRGATGVVTGASMVGGTLAVNFEIPTHFGHETGQFVGSTNGQGVFAGKAVLTPDNGEARSAQVDLAFQDDGSITASIDGTPVNAGFLPTDMIQSY